MQGMATNVYGGGKHYFNVTVKDDRSQAHYITDEIEANLKEGMPLRKRAPLLGLASLSNRCESEYDPAVSPTTRSIGSTNCCLGGVLRATEQKRGLYAYSDFNNQGWS